MLEYILDGGIVMFPLLFLSILSVAVIVDRVRVFRAAETDTARLQAQVADCLDDDRLDDAVGTCKRHAVPIAAVLLVGLERYQKLLSRRRGTAEVEANVTKTMADYAPHVVEALRRLIEMRETMATPP